MPRAVPTIEGEWFPMPRRGWRQQCCGCGLTHRWEFRIVAGKIEGRVWVCAKGTAAARRPLRKKVLIVAD